MDLATRGGSRPLRKLLTCLAALGAAGAVGCANAGDGGHVQGSSTLGSPSPTVVHHAPAQARPHTGTFLIARLRRGAQLPLRARPRGRVVTVVHPFTIFGSRTVLSAVERAHGWIAVTAPHLPNGSLGWFRMRHAPVEWSRIRSWVKVDLSARTITVGRGKHVVDRARVGIGQRGTPTPRGRFAITDKLHGPRFGPAYGRFILALSGTQTQGLSNWHGPKRLAIHGTPSPGKIGRRASLGCVVASDQKLARIVHEVHLGTPVIINA